MSIVAISLGAAQPLQVSEQRRVESSIHKLPVAGAVHVGQLGLAGDGRVEERKLGAESQAVYAFPQAHYAPWERALGRPLQFGSFGENLTISGPLETEARVGDRVRAGTALLQVTHPRIPCAKLKAHLGLRSTRPFLEGRGVGYYLRVLETGVLRPGDPFEVVDTAAGSPTIDEFLRISHFDYWDASGLRKLQQARDLPPAWLPILADKLERAERTPGWAGARQLKVVARHEPAPGFVSLDLECARGGMLPPAMGGAGITVMARLESDEPLARRYYALSRPASAGDTYRITVQLAQSAEGQGAVSKYLASLSIGDTIAANAPRCLFGDVSLEPGRRAVLVGIGVGAAPLLTLLEETRFPLATLVLAGRATGPLFETEIRELQSQLPGMQLRSTDVTKLRATLVRLHERWPDAVYFLAGEGPAVATAQQQLRDLGVEAGRVRASSFGQLP